MLEIAKVLVIVSPLSRESTVGTMEGTVLREKSQTYEESGAHFRIFLAYIDEL